MELHRLEQHHSRHIRHKPLVQLEEPAAMERRRQLVVRCSCLGILRVYRHVLLLLRNDRFRRGDHRDVRGLHGGHHVRFLYTHRVVHGCRAPTVRHHHLVRMVVRDCCCSRRVGVLSVPTVRLHRLDRDAMASDLRQVVPGCIRLVPPQCELGRRRLVVERRQKVPA